MLSVWIDTDIGDDIDDALALAFALHSPELELAGISTVYRNTEKRAAIARALLESSGRGDIPVYPGCNQPLIQSFMPHENDVYGDDGLYVPVQYLDSMDTYQTESDLGAVEAMIRAVRKHPGEIEVVAIGALTNLAVAIRLAPDLIHKVKGLTVMGGSYAQPRTEWNILCDPEAARIVFSSGIPIHAVGLNVTTKCVLTKENLEFLKQSSRKSSALLASMLERFLRHFSFHESVLHDPLTIGTLICPDFIKFEPVSVRVGLSNEETAGQTIAAPANSGADGAVMAAMEVDSTLYIKIFLERIAENTGLS